MLPHSSYLTLLLTLESTPTSHKIILSLSISLRIHRQMLHRRQVGSLIPPDGFKGSEGIFVSREKQTPKHQGSPPDITISFLPFP